MVACCVANTVPELRFSNDNVYVFGNLLVFFFPVQLCCVTSMNMVICGISHTHSILSLKRTSSCKKLKSEFGRMINLRALFFAVKKEVKHYGVVTPAAREKTQQLIA
jgi:hypothetical protein